MRNARLGGLARSARASTTALAVGAAILHLRAMSHNDLIGEGTALDAAAEAALVGAGERWTPMRASVFAALRSSERPASAYDIADAISKAEQRRVPANSIYRILDLFVTNNLARRVESANAYVANAHPADTHDCMFLICDRCGNVTHLDDDRVGSLIRKAAVAGGFQPDRPVIELHGRCRGCVEQVAPVTPG